MNEQGFAARERKAITEQAQVTFPPTHCVEVSGPDSFAKYSYVTAQSGQKSQSERELRSTWWICGFVPSSSPPLIGEQL
jgi:hypothetical protein